MSAGSIMNLLKELNKIIMCEPLASIILLYSTTLINLVMNLYEYIIFYLSCTKNKDCLKWKGISHQCAYSVMLTFSASLHYVCITQMTSYVKIYAQLCSISFTESQKQHGYVINEEYLIAFCCHFWLDCTGANLVYLFIVHMHKFRNVMICSYYL
jgi:hypothetical protein